MPLGYASPSLCLVGLVHAVNEMYGADASDDLLTKFGRCFTTYVQNRGFSAGISDLILIESAEEARTALVRRAPHN